MFQIKPGNFPHGEKTVKSLFSILAVLTLLVGLASAQAAPAATSFSGSFNPYVFGTIQTAPGSQATGGSYNLGIGLESNTKHFLFDTNGSFNSANVTAGAANGYTGTLQASGYYKLFGHILGGGGANWVINTAGFSASHFVNTARESANPFVGVGLQAGRLRSIATYELSGRNALEEQIKFGLNTEFAASKHIRLVVPLVINSYQSGPVKSLGGQRVTVASVGAGFKFVF